MVDLSFLHEVRFAPAHRVPCKWCSTLRSDISRFTFILIFNML
jgi:hypothetical protein